MFKQKTIMNYEFCFFHILRNPQQMAKKSIKYTSATGPKLKIPK